MAPDDPQSTAARLIGSTVSDRYRIIELLGEGGMGAVYLAEHVHMRKRVALKLLHAEMVERPEVVARFEREAVAAAHIDHPNVVAATDFGRTDDGSFFLVLEYIEGTNLRDALDGGALEPRRALSIARQIADALSRAHPMGIVHRDLKPENVMLVPRGAQGELVKVLDFGIAKINVDAVAHSSAGGTGPVLTRAGMIFGTPEYMAPEQALGGTVDARADLYTLGVMLYEMVTGARPFDDGEATTVLVQQITSPAPPMGERAPRVPVAPVIEAIAMRLLAKQASDRYDTAVEVIEALDAAAQTDLEAFSQGGSQLPAPSAPRSAATAPGAFAKTQAADAFAKTSLSLPEAPLPRAIALHTLRAQLPPALRRLPPAVLVAAPIAFLLVLLGVFALGARAIGGSTSGGQGDAAAGSASAGDDAPVATARREAPSLDAAIAGGPAALTELARAYPNDPRIPRELVRAYTRAGEGDDAMRALVTAIAADPSAAKDPEMDAAVTAAATNKRTVDAALAVMQGPLGEHGADLLIELAGRPSPNPLRERYLSALGSADVRAHASKAALVWIDLRTAKSCSAKYDVLARAKDAGDERALTLLKPLSKKGGCGFLGRRDCWACMRGDDALSTTIEAIESRGHTP